MITAVYYRVSTVEQKTDSQKHDVEKYLRIYGLSDVKIFEDHFTGRTMNRPEWKQLEALIDAGKVKTLIIYRLDRLGRSAAGLVALFEKFRLKGVNLISIKDSIDLETPSGRLTAHVLASVAAFETEVRRERIRDGITAAQKYVCLDCDRVFCGKNDHCVHCESVRITKLPKTAGKWSGRPKGSLGKKTRERYDMIMRLYREGHSQVNIAKLTGIDRSTVNKLVNES